MAQRPVVTLTTESDLLDVPQTGDTYLLAADVAVTGNITVTGTVDGRDVASDGALAATALQSETSHADVLVDGDFGSSGLMTTDGAGGYSITTNGSANWDTAYGWGNHASGGYLTSASIDTLAELNAIVVDATLIDTGDSRLSDARTPTAHNQAWSTITATPTTLAGYGITDAAASSHTHEGTAILSTGEVGGTKVLTENGSGGATWAAPAGGGAFSADAQTQITPSTAIVLDEATGDEDALRIDYTTNKATSGDDTGLVVNQTDTASPGTSLLADFQVGGSSVLQITPIGYIYSSNPLFGLDGNNYINPGNNNLNLRAGGVAVYNGKTTGATFKVGADTSSGDCFTFTQNNPAANEMTASSGVQSMMYITPVVNQSGTAGYNGILVNATETALGSGTSNLIDLQVGGVSKASIDNAGKVWLDPAGTLGTTTGLWFGAGADTGFYEKYNNQLEVKAAGSAVCRFASVGITLNNGPLIYNSAPSATTATYCRDNTATTGLGFAAADQLSLIAGGVEGVRISETANVITTDIDAGDNAAGNIGALTSIKSAIATVSSSAAATLTATSLIPAGCFMIGLTARITTTFGNSTGLTSFDIGDGADVDRWGAAIAITSGTTVDITNATAATHGSYAAANNVVLTANGGNFDATGVIELLIHYISLTAPTG